MFLKSPAFCWKAAFLKEAVFAASPFLNAKAFLWNNENVFRRQWETPNVFAVFDIHFWRGNKGTRSFFGKEGFYKETIFEPFWKMAPFFKIFVVSFLQDIFQ